MRCLPAKCLLAFLLFLAPAVYGQLVVRTIAGAGSMGSMYTGDNGPAYGTPIGTPYGVCADTSGTIYYSDYANKVVKRISRNGIITTIAGNGVPSSVSNPDANGDGGPASASRIIPQPIILDKAGNLYIGDAGTATVRRISSDGIISTYAGNRGVVVIGGDGGPATAAGLGGVNGLAFDKNGNLYIACSNGQLRKVNTSGIISTVVNGGGTAGYGGDGGPAAAAAGGALMDVALDSAQNIYVIDGEAFVVRKVNTSGIISRYAGIANSSGTAGDAGQATLAKLSTPQGIECDKAGNLYISDANRIRVVNASSGIISTYAGSPTAGYAGDGAPPSSTTRFNGVGQLSFDRLFNMYIPDKGNTTPTSISGRRIREIRQRDTFDMTVSPSAVLCGNTSALFTAHPHNAYYSYVYRWHANGTPVGGNAPVYSSATVHNHDTVTCTIYDTASGGIVLAISDTIIMTVLPPVNPELSVTSTGDTVCLGLPITFTANSIGGGAAPVYKWYVFGAPYYTGATFTYTPLVGQIVSCVLTSNDACAFPVTDTVHRALSVIPSYQPHAEITASPDAMVDYWSQMVTFFCEITYGGSDPVFQWYKNNVPIPGATSQTYFEEIYARASYYCVVNSNGYCAVPSLDTSNVILLNTGTLGVEHGGTTTSRYSIYPNPNNGMFTVSGAKPGANAVMELRNMLGQILYTTRLAGLQTAREQQVYIPASVLSGMYIITIADATTLETFAVMIQ